MIFVKNFFSQIDVFNLLCWLKPWNLKQSFNIFEWNCRLSLSSHSFELFLDFFFHMRRKIFRINFFLDFCSVIFTRSHSKSTKRDSTFYWWSRWCPLNNFGHVLSHFLFDVNDRFDILGFIFEMRNESFDLYIMFVHLK